MKGYQNREVLKAKYDELQSMKKVAEYFGVSKRLIMNYMNKFNLPRKPMRLPINMDMAVEYHKNGYSTKEIARMLCVSQPTARKRLQELGYDTDHYHKGYLQKESGYILVYAPDHPRADNKGYVPEHTIVAESELGRRLADNEVVHHINGNKADNAPGNLQVMDEADHKSMHSRKDRKICDLGMARALLDSGYTMSEVSAIFGLSVTGLRKKLHRSGLHKKLPRGTPAHKKNRIKAT